MRLHLPIRLALLALFIATGTQCDFVCSFDPITPPTILENEGFNAINWCPAFPCQFLATGDAFGLVSIYQFDQQTETLSLTTSATLGYYIVSVAWCPTCSFLAAGGRADAHSGIIQVYNFDSSNPDHLETVGSSTRLGDDDSSAFVAWCPTCSFLAAAASSFVDPNRTTTIQVYGFDTQNPGDLVAIDDSLFIADQIVSIKWCPDCEHLLASGFAGLYIYTFRPTDSPALVLTSSASIVGSFSVSKQSEKFRFPAK